MADATFQSTPLFSSEQYLGAVAAAYYPGKPWSVEFVSVEGISFKALIVGGRMAPNGWPFPFYYDPLVRPPSTGARPAVFIAMATHGIADRERCLAAPPPSPLAFAPFVDWSPFSSWDAYAREVIRKHSRSLLMQHRRLRRKLEREVGEVTFSIDDPDALVPLVRWKSAQYRRNRLDCPFDDSRATVFFSQLRDRGLLTVPTLRAGPHLVAANAGSYWDGTFSNRIAGYNPDFRSYNPGTLLHLALLEACFRAGHRAFDFLFGGEPYKWNFATHARLVGPIGREPWRDRAGRVARHAVGGQLSRAPRLLAAARAVERRLRFRS